MNPPTAFELAVLRAVGYIDRPAIEVTTRLFLANPELRTASAMAQWLFGAEVWRTLQDLGLRGLVAVRTAAPLLSSFKPTLPRKAYSLTLAGIDALAQADVEDIMERVRHEAPTEPPPPDTQPDLPREDS
jgi:hypothetical protein